MTIRVVNELLLGEFKRTDRIIYKCEEMFNFAPIEYNVDLNTRFSDHRYTKQTSLLISKGAYKRHRREEVPKCIFIFLVRGLLIT